MTYIALIVLGLVAATKLPVSLMPEIDIPKITVHINEPNMSARELENTVVKKLRHSLSQTNHLADITSEAMAGRAVINLQFEYGTRTDLAFIEVNEKIDHAVTTLPKEMERPKVIKANATDIPVFYINLTLRQDVLATTMLNQELNQLHHTQFNDLSRFTQNVIQKRIEQLESVALADASGLSTQEVFILPNRDKLAATGITTDEIENALLQNNIDLGNLVIRDGHYQYNIRVGNELKTVDDIKKVYVKKKGKLYKIKELASVELKTQERVGLVLSDGKDAITVAVIKQGNSRIKDLKFELNRLIENFTRDYPNIEFTITRSQTQLLDYSITNLKQNFYIGAFLSFVIMFFFLRDFQSPIIIGISIPISLIISFLIFHLAKLSINIISLSGMILGIGMMIDNAIIVIDNIHQHGQRGTSLESSCVIGANEVFRPLFSSVLTTCAVFIPLIFIGNISGAIFYDQAIAVTIGLLVSLVVSITLIPVLYYIFYRRKIRRKTALGSHYLSFMADSRSNILLKSVKSGKLVKSKFNDFLSGSENRKGLAGSFFIFYNSGLKFTLRKQPFVWLIVLTLLVGTVLLFENLTKSKFPAIIKEETLLFIDWNENVNLEENKGRISDFLNKFDKLIEHSTGLIGGQQFMLDQDSPKTTSEGLLYLKFNNSNQLELFVEQSTNFLGNNYPNAVFEYRDVGSIFEQLFADNTPILEARLRANNDLGENYNEMLQLLIGEISDSLPKEIIHAIMWENMVLLKPNQELLTLYNIDYNKVYKVLKQAFRQNRVFTIQSNQNYMPVVLGDSPQSLSEILNRLVVKNKKGENVRITTLFNKVEGKSLKTVIAGQEGEYFPIGLYPKKNRVNDYMNTIRSIVNNHDNFEVGFTGSYFTNLELIKDLSIILIISLALLYFILASQFESVLLPFIVLLEVPIDIFGAFIFLKIFGAGINIMSLIGIVVMSGIIINDSILKIDTINRLRMEGYSVIRAIKIGGQRRLQPILMTSLTTILALVPFLFTSGMGSDLQKPLAISVIGGMLIGTLVSLYFIPLCYYYLDTLQSKFKERYDSGILR